jgi:hypothetical protein
MDMGCSFNYVFYELLYPTPEDPEPIPDVFIGTAGYCTEGPGERVQATESGIGGDIGTVVYDSEVAGNGMDFSLIKLDPEMVGLTNPQMRGYEGPKGIATPGMLAVNDRLDVYGYGVMGLQGRERFGLLNGWTENEYLATWPPVSGDAGAPVLHDRTGYALGVMSRTGYTRVPPSTHVGPLVTTVLDQVRAAGFDVVLATID